MCTDDPRCTSDKRSVRMNHVPHHPLYCTSSPISHLVSSSSSSPFIILLPLPPFLNWFSSIFFWATSLFHFILISSLKLAGRRLSKLKKIFWHEPCVFAFSRWIKNGQVLFSLKSTFLSKNPGQSGQGPHCIQFTVCTVLQWARLHCLHLSEPSRIFYDALNCSIALNCQTYVLLYIVQFLLKVILQVTLQSKSASGCCLLDF